MLVCVSVCLPGGNFVSKFPASGLVQETWCWEVQVVPGVFDLLVFPQCLYLTRWARAPL